MRFLYLSFLLALVGGALSVLSAGAITGLTLLCGTAALLLLALMRIVARAGRRPARQRAQPRPRRAPQPADTFKDIDNPILVDGSNVLHWKDNTPSAETLRSVLRALEAQGRTPLVGFDANAGYLIMGQYMDAGMLARCLRITPDQVSVAPKGTPADPLLIEAATNLQTSIVTNDRYRDWEGRYPQIRERGFLLRGEITDSEVRLGGRPRPTVPATGAALRA